MCFKKVKTKFPNENLILRSSSDSEDNWNSSGEENISVLNVNSDDKNKLQVSIDEVFNSYKYLKNQVKY